MSALQLLSPEKEHRSLINQMSHFYLLARDKPHQFKKARQALGTSTTVQPEDIRLAVENRYFLPLIKPHTLITVIAMCLKVATQPCKQTILTSSITVQNAL